MPHVVLAGPVEMEEVFRRLRPVFVKTDRGIAKATDAYIDRGRRTILVEAQSLEEGEELRFLIMLRSVGEGLEVRLFPVPEVKATEGVRTVLVETAKQLMATFPELEVGATDLQRYLD